MPFEIVRNDIVNMQVDAIVNTANPRPVIGAGTDSAIHRAAGPGLLLARLQVGAIDAGCAAITPAFLLKAQYVIHTVGPVWQGGGCREAALLRSCYENSLQLAVEKGCTSVAFPLISTGTYGFPKDLALQIAVSVFSEFLLHHELQIYLVVYDQTSFQLSEKLFRDVASYIDENYVDAHREYRTQAFNQRLMERRPMPPMAPSMAMPMEDCMLGAAPSKSMSLEDWLRKTDAGFTETLLRLIDKTGKKDSEIYKRANLSKQHFSKIRNNPDYKPTKATAVALALALELDLDETRDLIGRAGYALTNSSKFDLIICYFIERGVYDVMEINLALYQFDQVLLGQ